MLINLQRTFLILCFIFLPAISFAQSVSVEKIINADTILLDDGRVVGLIGVRPFEDNENAGIEFLQWFEMHNKETRIEFDKKMRDDRGRWLAYLYIKICEGKCVVEAVYGQHYEYLDDGLYLFVNATLLKSGIEGLLLERPNQKYNKLFRKLHKEARINHRGIFHHR